MNPGLERWTALSGLLLLLASAQFFCCLGGAAPALPASLLLGAGVTWLIFRAFAPVTLWAVPLAITFTDLAAILIAELGLRPSFALWFCPLLAGGTSLATLVLLRRNQAKCTLCHRHLSRQAVVFRCPRCQNEVCDETCWSFEHRRCQLCLEQRVPVLPISDTWWQKVTGPRMMHGRCQLCLAAPETADLRACPRCRRAQCRSCWDFNNGECARCGETLPELPASLTIAMAKVASAYTTGSTPSRI
ncbi:hypothetical protein [Silvibacterium dinghuense]|uniref:Uncharacterized protein n=1 Tax=Silvibacterium dinghuense TaxID=1560006 RepID=A0A4Q1SJ50_9BACT|nr:hypothetical protein [Silvibacterium dinghuense]RXS97447.1 hypothetical protein ESZ00_05995 [Silvibacterium dinghuense]GGG99091.1 hypothetical protein GCM10011586_13230 [Silvibacterium dinghuense]